MRILLVGATGFIGRHLLKALTQTGHQIVATSRQVVERPLPGVEWQHLDLRELADKPTCFSWPAAIDLLINATGELSSDVAGMHRLQTEGACALFDLAIQHGVRVLQISALGAGMQADVPFLASKAQADDYLLQHAQSAVVLRPSLVLGPGGTSSAWLQRLSPWPLIPLLDNRAQLQPLHVEDLCGAVLALLRHWPAQTTELPLVGPQAMSQGQVLDQLRHAQGWPPAHYWVLPAALSRVGATLGGRLGWTALNPQTWRLAQRDNLASADDLASTCGFRCAPLSSHLHDWPQAAQSCAMALQPLVLAVLLLIWLGTALVCLGPGFDWGLRIMAEAGITGWPGTLAVISGALLDAALGLGLLRRRWRRPILRAQIGLMLAYSLIISLWLPHYWFDPYMAVGKNFAVLLLSLWLLWLSPSPDTRHG